MESVSDIEKIQYLKDFKLTREECDWVIPVKLPSHDDRDLRITKSELYGIRKADVISGFDYEKASIGKPLAKLIFLRMSAAFLKLKNKEGYTWTVFDNLDKKFCLIMAVHYEIELISAHNGNEGSPLKGELIEFLKITTQNNVTDSDAASQWRKNKLMNRNSAKAKAEGGGKEELPRNLLRLAEVASYIVPYMNVVKSIRDFLRIIKVKPITSSESHLFRTPICRVSTVAAEYRYTLDLIRTAIYNDNEKGQIAMRQIAQDAIKLPKLVFQGTGFRGINEFRTPQSVRSISQPEDQPPQSTGRNQALENSQVNNFQDKVINDPLSQTYQVNLIRQET